MSLFNQSFVDHVTADLPILRGQTQIAGIKAIIDGFEGQLPGADVRWLAYMLATALHETAAKMEPVREAFWNSEEWRKAHLPYFPYYGRGYVQLTHKENYKRAGDDVGADFVTYPDLALRPDYAAHVMCIGMKEGWFRADSDGRHTLGRYFSERVDDPVGARKIINGKEKKIVAGKKTTVAAIIAGYYSIFLSGLQSKSSSQIAAVQMVSDQSAAPFLAASLDLVSNRFDNERTALLALAEPLSLSEPMTHMVDVRDTRFPASHPRFWGVIDFRQRSDQKRFHIFDIEAKSVNSYLCAHGKGSDLENTGFATSFSNEDGSNMSSLGVYQCAETYIGEHGYSMKLDGLEPTNNLARHRVIVVHSADYVSDDFAQRNRRVGRSLGCPAVDAAFSEEIINCLKMGSFLIAWTKA
ncbi:murein L,D-transpeptidase catalytic domain-containing protein [Rhizobium lusitanum]|uniref:Glycoside hydrolase family 19 catalytic domain-containing protein n=1 Tax=Rhizobium lusitanum TaxID=293958 RepID=A0A7X0IUA2_9HYPH|nr:murein L,D-transpeptidase catalytic domain family protein [Rhizobium lusitanum]MBB6486853.1 hypothetical protein [Rhizobium lusitanum]